MLVLFHISGCEQTAKRNTNPASFGHRRKGPRGSGRLTWGLALNGPPVIGRSLMTQQNWSRNGGPRTGQRASAANWAMRIRWGGEPRVPVLDPAYRGSGALTSVTTHGCVIIVLRCCPRRWIDPAFSATKSLGVHTGAGSGNSNTALSRPAKQDNVSCPIRAGLASAQKPYLLQRDTLPASHFTNKAAFWRHSY